MNNIIPTKLNVREFNVEKEDVITQQQNCLFCKYIFNKIIFLQLNFYSTNDDYIRNFHDESVDVCDVFMEHSDEITSAEAREHKYRKNVVQMTDEQENTDEYEYNILFYLL